MREMNVKIYFRHGLINEPVVPSHRLSFVLFLSPCYENFLLWNDLKYCNILTGLRMFRFSKHNMMHIHLTFIAIKTTLLKNHSAGDLWTFQV